MLNKEEIMRRFCGMLSRIADKVYCNKLRCDCFCGSNPFADNFKDARVDAEIIAFIENAVTDKIKNILVGREIKDLDAEENSDGLLEELSDEEEENLRIDEIGKDIERGLDRRTLSSLLGE